MHRVLTGGVWTWWCRCVSGRGEIVGVGIKVSTPSSHLAVQTTFSGVHLYLSKRLRCDLWCRRHRCGCVIYVKLSSVRANACGNLRGSKQTPSWWEAAGGCVSARARTPAVFKLTHLMSVLPAISCCPCGDTPSLSSVRLILGTAAYYCFSKPKVSFEETLLKRCED